MSTATVKNDDATHQVKVTIYKVGDPPTTEVKLDPGASGTYTVPTDRTNFWVGKVLGQDDYPHDVDLTANDGPLKYSVDGVSHDLAAGVTVTVTLPIVGHYMHVAHA